MEYKNITEDKIRFKYRKEIKDSALEWTDDNVKKQERKMSKLEKDLYKDYLAFIEL